MIACKTQILQCLTFLVVSLGKAVGQITSDYVFIQKTMSWAEAREFCRRHFVDMAILSTEEQYFSMLNTTASSEDSYWMGLQRQDVSSSWKWVNGEELTYKRWYIRDYVGRCATLEAMLGKDNKLLARLCDEHHMLACQGPAAPQSVAVNTSDTDALSLSWTVSPLMQMIPHSYYVEICGDTCNTVVSPYTNSSATMTVNITGMASAKECSVAIAAFVVRPDHLTGQDAILQSHSKTLHIKNGGSVFFSIFPFVLKFLKALSATVRPVTPPPKEVTSWK